MGLSAHSLARSPPAPNQTNPPGVQRARKTTSSDFQIFGRENLKRCTPVLTSLFNLPFSPACQILDSFGLKSAMTNYWPIETMLAFDWAAFFEDRYRKAGFITSPWLPCYFAFQSRQNNWLPDGTFHNFRSSLEIVKSWVGLSTCMFGTNLQKGLLSSYLRSL